MKWVLVYTSILFLILRLRVKSPYEKYYPEDGLWRASFDPRFSNYLGNMKEEVKIRLNPFLMSWREPVSRFFHPDEPVNWQEALVTRKDKFLRALADLSLIAYGIVVIDAVRGAYVLRPWGNIPGLLDILFLVAVLPAFIWLKKQSYVDGLTQGYLNGYMDGYEKAYLDAKIEDGKIKVAEE